MSIGVNSRTIQCGRTVGRYDQGSYRTPTITITIKKNWGGCRTGAGVSCGPLGGRCRQALNRGVGAEVDETTSTRRQEHGAPSGYGIGTPEVRTRTAFVPVHPSHPSQKSSPAGTKRALPPLQRRSLTVENTCIALIRKQKLRRFRNLTCGRRLHVFI